MVESRIVYFENPGKHNTDEVLRITRRRAAELGIKTIVVASKTGETAVKTVEALPKFRLVVVGDSTGFKEPDVNILDEENRRIVESKGGIFCLTTHVFSGISRAMRQKFGTHIADSIIANTLRIFGQGTKVCCEIAMMAADSGLVRTDEDVVCIAGTRGGADTAMVLKPVNTHNFFDFKIREILCKPHF